MGTSRLNDLKIEYPNRKEFLSLKREIFINEDYQLDSIENAVIIDIGAYIGLSVIYFWLQHPGSEIHAYEPTPTAHKYLKENTQFLSGVKIFNKAVSSGEGLMDYYITNPDTDWLSNSSNRERSWTDKETSEMIQVEKISLGSILDNHHKIDILKVDVEGHEFTLIDEETDLSNVSNILIESHPIGENKISKLISRLRDNGFKLQFRTDGRTSDKYDPKELFIIKAHR